MADQKQTYAPQESAPPSPKSLDEEIRDLQSVFDALKAEFDSEMKTYNSTVEAWDKSWQTRFQEFDIKTLRPVTDRLEAWKMRRETAKAEGREIPDDKWEAHASKIQLDIDPVLVQRKEMENQYSTGRSRFVARLKELDLKLVEEHMRLTGAKEEREALNA